MGRQKPGNDGIIPGKDFQISSKIGLVGSIRAVSLFLHELIWAGDKKEL